VLFLSQSFLPFELDSKSSYSEQSRGFFLLIVDVPVKIVNLYKHSTHI
jgi:hypothetical protein